MDTTQSISSSTSSGGTTAAAVPAPVQTDVTGARATGGTTSAPPAGGTDAVQLTKEGLETGIAELENKPADDKVTKEDLEKRLAEMKKRLEELLGGETAPPEPPPPDGGYDGGGGGGGGCDGGGCNGGGGGGGGGFDGGGVPPLDNVNPPPSVDPVDSSGDWDTKLIQACMAVLQEKAQQPPQNGQQPQGQQNGPQPPNGQQPQGQQNGQQPLKLGWGAKEQAPAPPPPPPPPAKQEEQKKQQSAAVQKLIALYQQAKEAKAQLRPETEKMVQQTLSTAGASL